MPYMSPSPDPMDSSLASPLNDSSTKSPRSLSSQVTGSTIVSRIHTAPNGTQKRKVEPQAYHSRKYPRLDHDFRWTPSAHGRIMDQTDCKVSQKCEPSGAFSSMPLPACARLPALIWHKVLMYLPPKSLGQLLLVNHAFSSYLGGTAPILNHDIDERCVHTLHLDAEDIWTQSRRMHHHHLPRPLSGHSELSMWKLIGGKSCQFCAQDSGSQISHNGHAIDFARSPRSQGIRIHWALAIRCCNNCLKRETIMESELLASNLSYLLPALSFATIGDNGWSSPIAGVKRTHPVTSGAKRYLRREVEALRKQTSSVARVLDAAAAEVWLDTLKVSTEKRQRGAARWERWKSNGGAKKLRLPTGSPTRHYQQHAVPGLGFLRLPSPEALQPPATFESAQIAKNARVQEIIHRAAQLDPPIYLDVLRHMPAFSAAHNIPRQLDDVEWVQLQNRFREQRAEAERLAYDAKYAIFNGASTDISEQWDAHLRRPGPATIYHHNLQRRSQSHSPRAIDTAMKMEIPERSHTLFTPNNEHVAAFTQRPRVGQQVLPLPPPPPPPPHSRAITPHVLYDGFGNEYVRTSADHSVKHTPYVQYLPPPPRRY
ncbi:hypothetical protein EJ08DRAFT_645519 [Tothia fuscella]|uniref:F-box domain-containing protein n=1 Tax=Tothia fuscella TaxID=1048955 RepID=A0A9P4P0B0_9PEZI|nr:hypothetical protein EJ08DRAFT_645519 [Tothia fuscella]